jgi:WbqC-like protein family.
MQPYFMPYSGYFQLISAVDLFVIYDDIKYTKKGWINRNRMLLNGAPSGFSLPLKGASDGLDIRDRETSAVFRGETLLARVRGAYRGAPYFEPTYALLEHILESEERNLFLFLESSIMRTCEHLGIVTEIRRSSDVPIDHGLRGQDRVLAICEAVSTGTYVNAIGGVELYSPEAFRARGMELRFLQSDPLVYTQLGDAFVPQLSIIDVLMFNAASQVRDFLRTGYTLI